MEASPTVHGATRVRAVCMAAALLCALGVLSGVVVRSAGHTHHHHGSVAAAVVVADGQGGLARGDQSAVVGTAPTDAGAEQSSVTTAESSESADQVAGATARQRGPPADRA